MIPLLSNNQYLVNLKTWLYVLGMVLTIYRQHRQINRTLAVPAPPGLALFRRYHRQPSMRQPSRTTRHDPQRRVAPSALRNTARRLCCIMCVLVLRSTSERSGKQILSKRGRRLGREPLAAVRVNPVDRALHDLDRAVRFHHCEFRSFSLFFWAALS